MRKVYTGIDATRVKKLHKTGLTIREIARRLGIPKSSVYRMLTSPSSYSAEGEVEMNGNLWETAKQLSQLKINANKFDCDVKITANQPVLLVFMGDIHISDNCDFVGLEEDTKYIANLKDTYVFDLGDNIDNMIKTKLMHVNMSSRITIADQWELFEHWIKMLGPNKIIASISGNHELWTEQVAGVDIKRMLMKYNNLLHTYSRHEVTLNIEINNDLTYRVHGTHKFSMNSILNESHAPKQKIRMRGLIVDAIGMADRHVPITSYEYVNGRYVCIVRPASYKVNDDYAISLGLYGRHWQRTPTLVLDHKSFEMTVFPTVYQAQRYRLGYGKDKVC